MVREGSPRFLSALDPEGRGSCPLQADHLGTTARSPGTTPTSAGYVRPGLIGELLPQRVVEIHLAPAAARGLAVAGWSPSLLSKAFVFAFERSDPPEALISEVMDCLPEVRKGWGQREALEAIENLVRHCKTTANRMKYRLFGDDSLPVGSESALRHVLQTRMNG